MPALASGNTVVFKPSSYTAVCATTIVDVLQEADIPAGVLNLVHGRGEEAEEYLAMQPDIDALSSTGSIAVGKIGSRGRQKGLVRNWKEECNYSHE